MKELHELQKRDDFEFQAGDVASFGGSEGVINIYKNDYYPINYNGYRFTLKGMLSTYHTLPVLFLIDRPKKTAKVKYYQVGQKVGTRIFISNYYYKSLESLGNGYHINKNVFIEIEEEL